MSVLKEIRTARKGVYLRGTSVEVDGSSATASKNPAEFSSVERDGAGASTLTLKQGNYPGIVLATPSDSITDGGFASIGDAFDGSEVKVETFDEAGDAEDGSYEALILALTEKNELFSDPNWTVKGSNYKPRLIGAKIASDGEIESVFGGITVSKTGTGVYKLSFPKAFQAVPQVVATGSNDAGASRCKVVNKSIIDCDIEIYSVAGAAIDTGFCVLMYGSYVSNGSLSCRQPLLTGQYKPRIEFYYVDTTTGSLSIKSDDAALSSQATGSYIIEFNKPFQQVPVVVATAKGVACVVAEVTEEYLIVFVDNTNSDADVNLIVLGNDYPTEV